MSADNLPRLGLESVDSFNCAHGEGFYFVWNTSSRISPFPNKSRCFSNVGLWRMRRFLTSRLRNVGYYRFSAYLPPFRVRNSNGQIEDNYVP